jgi:NhaA family Na+:H+ antiporter
LFPGKQVGILLVSWLAVRLGIASPPERVGGWQPYGAAVLCGIGFAMSLFIASLASERDGAAYLGLEHLGMLIGSLISGVLGYSLLRVSQRAWARGPSERI